MSLSSQILPKETSAPLIPKDHASPALASTAPSSAIVPADKNSKEVPLEYRAILEKSLKKLATEQNQATPAEINDLASEVVVPPLQISVDSEAIVAPNLEGPELVFSPNAFEAIPEKETSQQIEVPLENNIPSNSKLLQSTLTPAIPTKTTLEETSDQPSSALQTALVQNAQQATTKENENPSENQTRFEPEIIPPPESLTTALQTEEKTQLQNLTFEKTDAPVPVDETDPANETSFETIHPGAENKNSDKNSLVTPAPLTSNDTTQNNSDTSEQPAATKGTPVTNSVTNSIAPVSDHPQQKASQKTSPEITSKTAPAKEPAQPKNGSTLPSGELKSEATQENKKDVDPVKPTIKPSSVPSIPVIETREADSIFTKPVSDSTSKIPAGKIVEQATQGMQKAAEAGQTFRVRLHPPELGILQIELARVDGSLVARIETDTPATQKILLESISQLKEALTQQGNPIEKIEIEWNQRGFEEESDNQQFNQTSSEKDQADRNAGLSNTDENSKTNSDENSDADQEDENNSIYTRQNDIMTGLDIQI